MMRPTYKICAVLSIFVMAPISLLFGEVQNVKTEEIHSLMQEILEFHVEHKKVTPELIKRSFKTFLQKFDPEKTYILQQEVSSFLNMDMPSLQKVQRSYEKGDFSAYESFYKIFLHSLERARLIRERVQKQLIFATKEIETSLKESYVGYAKTEEELSERIRKQTIDFLVSQKRLYEDIPWTVDTRQKIFTFYERKKRQIEESYDFSWNKEGLLATHILKALTKSLDAHTTFFTKEEAVQIRMSLEKEFEGLGIVFKETLRGVEVGEIIRDSPAEKSEKIEVGDILVTIDGKSIESDSYTQVMEKVARKGKPIHLGFLRKEENLEYIAALTPGKVVLKDERLSYEVENCGDGLIAKLTLPSFYENGKGIGCDSDIRKALLEIKKQGEIKGLILDLRYNSGGFLQQAVKVAGLFITNGVIVISKYANNRVKYLRELDGKVYYQGPLVILTSKGSASAAEIVAQALQDYGSALIVGDERTYGKGTIQYQTVTESKAKAFYKVTVGKYYTVSGKSTQMNGVKADIVVPSEYAYYNIGERFLEYSLSSDQMDSAFLDPLQDVDSQTKSWMKKNYMPNLQQKNLHWQKMVPILQENSSYRLRNNKDFTLFLEDLKTGKIDWSSDKNWGENDLQMQEAVYIIQDMIALDLLKK